MTRTRDAHATHRTLALALFALAGCATAPSFVVVGQAERPSPYAVRWLPGDRLGDAALALVRRLSSDEVLLTLVSWTAP